MKCTDWTGLQSNPGRRSSTLIYLLISDNSIKLKSYNIKYICGLFFKSALEKFFYFKSVLTKMS